MDMTHDTLASSIANHSMIGAARAVTFTMFAGAVNAASHTAASTTQAYHEGQVLAAYAVVPYLPPLSHCRRPGCVEVAASTADSSVTS